MARPTKQGIEYFPLDVHIDDKIKFIEIKYGLEGFSIIVKLLQKIYSESFWCMWGEDESLLFSSYINADYNKVNLVVEEALKRDFFSKELYEKHSILTSKGIQKRYREGVRRRKDVEVNEDYLLIDNNFGVNDGNNLSNGTRNDGKSTQSKVKESKVQESKEQDNKAENAASYLSAHFPYFSTIDKDTLYSYIDDLGDEMCIEAMKRARIAQKKLSYANGILKQWYAKGIRNMKDVELDDNNHNSKVAQFKPRQEQKQENEQQYNYGF
jgi:DnaD/phage-associated family protein